MRTYECPHRMCVMTDPMTRSRFGCNSTGFLSPTRINQNIVCARMTLKCYDRCEVSWIACGFNFLLKSKIQCDLCCVLFYFWRGPKWENDKCVCSVDVLCGPYVVCPPYTFSLLLRQIFRASDNPQSQIHYIVLSNEKITQSTYVTPIAWLSNFKEFSIFIKFFRF